MELKKKKNDHNNKLVFKVKFITVKDYNELNPYNAIIYDKRSFLVIFFDKLQEENVLFNLFFHESILQPILILELYYHQMIL